MVYAYTKETDPLKIKHFVSNLVQAQIQGGALVAAAPRGMNRKKKKKKKKEREREKRKKERNEENGSL